ncbi:MAG: hypothetical protein LBH46_03605, partial [Rickettsiales bacterium]|nr:hypothetical protein [Rickettsiales bacterium]
MRIVPYKMNRTTSQRPCTIFLNRIIIDLVRKYFFTLQYVVGYCFVKNNNHYIIAMSKYDSVKNLKEEDFRRLTGVKKET